MIYSDIYKKSILELNFDYHLYDNKTICISGATGLIGSYLIDYLLMHNDSRVRIIALVRNIDKAKIRFCEFKNDDRLTFIKANLSLQIIVDDDIDYVIHAASLTDPKNYSLYPVETMNVNMFGTSNLLKLALQKKAKFLFLSSCEVYGENSKKNLKEDEYGYIDILNPRACYNEAKKASETLCVSYKKEFNLDVLILRLSRVYGPTMKLEDTKALSQFINNALNNENIILKSTGEQLFNYTYVGDVVNAILIALINENKEICYNFASSELVPLKEIAYSIAKFSKSTVEFDLPNDIEKVGFSKANISSLDSTKFFIEFNINAQTSLVNGIEKTINLLKTMYDF